MTLPRLTARTPHPHRDHDTAAFLWPDGAPGALGDNATDHPALTIHLPDPAHATGTAVIICPGGGYHILAADHEGLQMARYLNRLGIAAFVLRYRLQPDYDTATARLDGQRAIRWVRSRSDEYGISPDRIGVLGFSAGGHLASSVGTTFDAGRPDPEDPVDSHGSRPDFLILIYAAISNDLFGGRTSQFPTTHEDVDRDTPPTFLLSTHEDRVVSPRHSLLFYEALLEQGVPAELHVFGFGVHGTGLAPGDPHLNQWTHLLPEWLNQMGLSCSEPRLGISGRVTLDGEPLFWGWLTLVPEDTTHPVVSLYLTQSEKGTFMAEPGHGPVSGRYRPQLYAVAAEFLAPKEGHYSMNDAVLAELDPASGTVVHIAPGQTKLNLAFRTPQAGS